MATKKQAESLKHFFVLSEFDLDTNGPGVTLEEALVGAKEAAQDAECEFFIVQAIKRFGPKTTVEEIPLDA